MKLLIESIQILSRFAHEIANRTSLIVDFGFPKTGFNGLTDKDLTLLNSLFYMIVIDAVSYLNEYEQVLGVVTEKQFIERVKIVKAINKPFISQIKKWKDLEKLRNNLIAHNLRVGKNGPYIFSVENPDYNAPKTLNDAFLLSNLIQFASQTLTSEFSNEIKNYSDPPFKYNPKNQPLSKDEVSTITVTLIKQADDLKRKYNRNYDFNFSNALDWNKV